MKTAGIIGLVAARNYLSGSMTIIYQVTFDAQGGIQEERY